MKKITAPGIYEVEINRYHHDPDLCDGPSISSSGIRQIMIDCPAKFWASYAGNPKRIPPKETSSFDIGKAVHSLVLGEPEFNKYFVISPFDDFRSKSAQQWRDSQTRTIIRAGEGSRNEPGFDALREMAAAQKASPQVARAFEDGRAELSLFWRDEETGIWLKARPDWLPNDPVQRFITEYKSALTIEPRKFSSAAFEHGYHIQAAMQFDGVREVMGVKPLGVAHVCQEKDAPFLAELRMFAPEQVDDGRLLYRLGLKRFAACLKLNEWPSYTEEATYFETPYWHAQKMESIRHGIDSYSNGGTPTASRYEAGDYISAG